MYRGLTVAVVVPAFNEAQRIAAAIRAVPAFVDRIVVVDDASRDKTSRLARRAWRRGLDERAAVAGGPARLRRAGGRRGPAAALDVIRHIANRGVGGAIVTGYRRALELGVDVAVVMAGDGQMDPADLPALLDPIADGRAEYVKGNRFLRREVWREMPASRIAGNVLLSIATKFVSGYWGVFDSQCGYTAASRAALLALELDRLFPRYGYPNDLLARLHAVGARVVDVPVRPIYGPDWKSGIRLHTVFYPIAWVLLRAWVGRVRAEWFGVARPRLPPADESADYGFEATAVSGEASRRGR